MRQKLGQHFLINKTAIEKIIAALEILEKEIIIEIGPGKEALSNELIKKLNKEKISKLFLIEKDGELVSALKQKYSNKKNIEIIYGDALKEIPKIAASLKNTKYKIIGNIPYYITGKLLRIISELKFKPFLTVLMIQKEVAERIIAKPPKMNLLAAAVQFWAKPEIIFALKPADFSPPPQVDSAVIRLTKKPPLLTDKTSYYQFIHNLFKQPRKTIANNLKKGLKIPKKDIENNLKTLKISPKSRPQNIKLEEIKKLIDLFTS